MAKHANAKKGESKGGAGKVVAVALALALVAVIGACAAVVVVRPPFAMEMLGTLGVEITALPFSEGGLTPDEVEGERESFSGFGGLDDKVATSEEAADFAAQARRTRQTPLVAQCAGVDIRSAVVLPDVTGIMFHQASYDYALPLETQLPEADYNTAADTRTIRVNREQDAKPADWADADVLHLWRTTDATEMDTSIDLGAPAGTEVRAPVSGTVVLVRDYELYDEMPDIEVHIQPEGRADLDCVLIHLTDACVKAGDKVEAGITPIAKVRDIEAVLVDVQLGFFTPEGTGGNHTHIQVNSADYPGYREKKLEGAVSAS